MSLALPQIASKAHMNPKLEFTLAAKRLGYFLTKNQSCIATAEACTGGWLAQSITDIAGSLGWFDRGFITYNNSSKSEMLSVKKQTIQEFRAVSAEVAKLMQ